MNKTKKWALSLIILITACAVSAIFAFGNYYYYQWVNRIFDAKDAVLSALLYSSFSFLIGGMIIIWKPRFYGFQIGKFLKKWRLVLLISAVVCAFTIICLLLTPRTPYSGANWAVEMIIVPITEESLWRGVIYALVFKFLSKLFTDKTSFTLTVIFSSIAFGLAHVSNVLVHPVSFVMLQMIFAAIAGSGMGYLRGKTKSIYPAIILHGLFNLIAIIL